MLIDGFKAAEILKKTNPEAFKIMDETVIRFRDIGQDYTKFNKLNITKFFV